LTRILLVGASGWGNLGDDLIADRIVQRLSAQGDEVVVAGGPHRLGVMAPQVILGGSPRHRARAIWEAMRSDEIHIGGGGLFDDRDERQYRTYVRAARLAWMLRKPYRLVAVGVGPIRRPTTAAAYRWVFDHAASATVRDAASRARIVQAGSARPPEVVWDPALWSPEPLAHIGPSHDVLVNLRGWEWGERAEAPAAVPTRAVIDAVAEALNKRYPPEASIGLASMSTLAGHDDSQPLELLASRLHSRLTRYYGGDLARIDEAVAAAHLVLSMRLHLCLLGVARGVPVAGLAYDPKVSQQGAVHGFRTLELDNSFTGDAVSELLDAVSHQPR
jgi:polysaccharide pyruvyl transferase WcaK-like protein